MNWKNLRINPPKEDCSVVISRRSEDITFCDFQVWVWLSKQKKLERNSSIGYRVKPFAAIPDNMYYINLTEIK